jgi:lysophospholipase L1-like esterase
MGSRVRIMPLGDSITLGFGDETDRGGYRGPLYEMLAGAGFDVEFVGSESNGAIPHPRHEGQSGWFAEQIRDSVYSWLDTYPADIVLLHIGTNNIIHDGKAPAIMATIAQVLDEIDRFAVTSHIAVIVVLAQLIHHGDPLAPHSAENLALNRSIAAMAAGRIAAGRRLVVANFEPTLSYPVDYLLGDMGPDHVHPNAGGYRKMAPVWFDALAPILRNRTVPAQGYTLDILTGLVVDQNGVLQMTSVVDVEHWKPLVSIGNPVFAPGAPVAMAKQTDGVLTAVAVDKFGRMVVASVGGAGIWQPPVGISDTVFLPHTHVAIAKQTDGVLTAIAVDKFGRLVVASVGGLGTWQPPVGISEDVFLPGVPVAMAKQTDGVLTALAVDKFGHLLVASVAGLDPWQRPVGISNDVFLPRTHVAMAKQTDGVLTAMAVDKFARLVVASVAGLDPWQRPVGISDANFVPGASVAMAKQTDGVLTALTVDKFGRLVVTSAAGLDPWQAPVGISTDIFTPGASVAMSKQVVGVLSALAVDKGGHLVVASVPGLGAWQAPSGISSAIFSPGAPVAMAKQIDGVNLRAFIETQPRFSGSSIAQRIGQLTGNGPDPEYRDIGGNVPQVFNRTADYGVKGVDLGANAEIGDKLVFFFGDVPTTYQAPDDQSDWVAFTSNTPEDRVEPLSGLALTSVNTGNWFHPYSIKGIGPLAIAQTPTGAFGYPGAGSNGETPLAYVFAFYNPNDPAVPNKSRGSLLTKSFDATAPEAFDNLFPFSTFEPGSGKFFQVAPWVVRNSDFPGLFPSRTGDGLVLMGQGGPANSVHLAWMPLAKGSDPHPSTIRYYRGRGGRKRSSWSRKEADAQTLFSTIGYTSLSLTWVAEAKRWLLLYSLASPGAIPLHNLPADPVQHNPNGPVVARVGTTPWDWSDEIIVFDPLRDNALGRFMHRPGDDLNTVAPVLPPEAERAYGGEPSYAYGPFPLNRYTTWRPAARDLTIYYLLSTYRPYQVQLMRSHFHVP